MNNLKTLNNGLGTAAQYCTRCGRGLKGAGFHRFSTGARGRFNNTIFVNLCAPCQFDMVVETLAYMSPVGAVPAIVKTGTGYKLRITCSKTRRRKNEKATDSVAVSND